jgi:DNA-binding NtrC family response regulator
VLVVDDEPGVRKAVREVLTRADHEVRDVADGSEALRLLETLSFDLVITDVYMAAVDGVELLARMQQRGIQVPVVAMSGGGYRSREDVLKMAASIGAVATLDKPFSVEQLMAAVQLALKPPTSPS